MTKFRFVRPIHCALFAALWAADTGSIAAAEDAPQLPALALPWPSTITPVLSPKDAAAPEPSAAPWTPAAPASVVTTDAAPGVHRTTRPLPESTTVRLPAANATAAGEES